MWEKDKRKLWIFIGKNADQVNIEMVKTGATTLVFPEHMHHPSDFPALVDTLKKRSEEESLAVWTHSPYLLDYFDPEDIVVVKDSKVTPLLEIAGAAVVLKILTPGEYWASYAPDLEDDSE